MSARLDPPRAARVLPRIPCALALLAGAALAQSDDLDEFLVDRMRAAHVPGLSACIVKGDRLAWVGAHGHADVERDVPVLPDTLFMLASVSKTVTGTALMQLWEGGLFELDEDVGQALRFRMRNPHQPEQAITYRSLLSHVSGIRDNWAVLDSLYVRGDSPIPLGFFVAGYLAPGGVWYDEDLSFYPWGAETHFAYSNVGFALVGHLVEALAGIPFDEHCEREIFGPLGMQDSSWRLASLDPDQVAVPHAWDPMAQEFVPYGSYGYPDYPDGGLRTSARELGRFLLAHMNGGELDGRRILEPATVAAMRTAHYPALEPTQGLAFHTWVFQGSQLVGHAGGDWGVATEMWFRPADGVGVVLLINGDPAWGPYFDILARLLDEGEAL